MSPSRKTNAAKKSGKETKQKPTVMLVSGGTGHTAQELFAAALAQFPDQGIEVLERFGVRTQKKATAVVNEAAEKNAILMHTLVDPKIRHTVDVEARERGIPYVDILGPSLSVLGDHLSSVPRGRAGLLYEVHREQLDRLDAVDFTLAHDDGLGLHELDLADVVLVGASRTSKSVTCLFLAMRGVCAANVPLIPGCPLPEELTKLDSDRVIGLTMNPAHLASLRQTRMGMMSHREIANYADTDSIKSELDEIRRLITAQGWPCIDVSYKAVEELAEQILEMIPSRK